MHSKKRFTLNNAGPRHPCSTFPQVPSGTSLPPLPLLADGAPDGRVFLSHEIWGEVPPPPHFNFCGGPLPGVPLSLSQERVKFVRMPQKTRRPSRTIKAVATKLIITDSVRPLTRALECNA